MEKTTTISWKRLDKVKPVVDVNFNAKHIAISSDFFNPASKPVMVGSGYGDYFRFVSKEELKDEDFYSNYEVESVKFIFQNFATIRYYIGDEGYDRDRIGEIVAEIKDKIEYDCFVLYVIRDDLGIFMNNLTVYVLPPDHVWWTDLSEIKGPFDE